MREFEEALRRARANIAEPQGEAAPPKQAGDPADTTVLPERPGAATPPERARQFPPRPEGPSAPSVPTPSVARPPQRVGADLSALPLLDANVAFFRENFGSHGGDSAVVDGAFRILRTRVLEAMKARGGHVLGITSPAPGAGKTVTSIHLALACARRAEQTVILADFDLRRPAISQYLDATGFRPSVDYFRGEAPVTDFLYRNEAGNLLYLLTDRATEMSAEHLASSRTRQALEQLRKVAPDPLIILDLPPMTGCDDTLAVLPELDGVLLVLAANESRFGHFEEAVSLLPRDKLIGTVLNKAKGAQGAYDYY